VERSSSLVSRIVVVGAGAGGLAVAARLASLGHQVTVCEQSDTTGGKLAGYTRDGFVFDTGPSLLTWPEVYHELFSETGTPLDDQLELQRLPVICRYRFSDGSWLDVPNTGINDVTAAMGTAFGPDAATDWHRLIQRAEAMWAATRVPFVESPIASAGSLIWQARRWRDLRTIAPLGTLRGLGCRQLRDPRLRAFLDRYATYTGSDPRRAPAALAVIPYLEQTSGAWHVRGGLHRLAEALTARAIAAGATIRTATDAVDILTDQGRASGIRLATGERLSADVVVANADARHVYGSLTGSSSAAIRRSNRRLSRATPSLSGFVLLLALRGRTPGAAHHTVLFPQNYDAEFDDIFTSPARPVTDPAIYMCSPDDPSMRPDHHHESWFVLVNAPRHEAGQVVTNSTGVDWDLPGLADRYADQVLGIMAARGVDIRDRVVWRETRTPADLERATRTPGGAIYGTSSHGASSAFVRPANRSPLPGLFLVGGSSHPGGGLPMVATSAAIVARLIGPS
jgi:phytoene desaturase